MNLHKKKMLAQRTLGVGKYRIVFIRERLDEIKQAITKQDIRDLVSDKAIIIKPIKGRRIKIYRGKQRRSPGKIKKDVYDRKRVYLTLTRKLRKFLKSLRARQKISSEDYSDARKKIRAKYFQNLSQLKEYLRK
jgi:large subunit ribosomal protein L19e